jgi:ribosomal protein S27AE
MSEQRTCRKCGLTKPVATDFRPVTHFPNRTRYTCRTCETADGQRWRENNPDRARESWRRNRNNEKGSARKADWVRRNKQKDLAQRRLRDHCRRGKIQRQTVCEQCGSGGYIHAHHDDYAKPLDVRWLCAKCHNAVHRVLALRAFDAKGEK